MYRQQKGKKQFPKRVANNKDNWQQYYCKNNNKPKTLYVSLNKTTYKPLSETLGFNISKPLKGKKYEIL